jgi:hypothetical protein
LRSAIASAQEDSGAFAGKGLRDRAAGGAPDAVSIAEVLVKDGHLRKSA